MSDEPKMIAKQLAHEFFLGIRTAMTCPDVSVAEYEDVVAMKIQKVIDEAVRAEREALLKKVGELRLELENDAEGESTIAFCTHMGGASACEEIESFIRGTAAPQSPVAPQAAGATWHTTHSVNFPESTGTPSALADGGSQAVVDQLAAGEKCAKVLKDLNNFREKTAVPCAMCGRWPHDESCHLKSAVAAWDVAKGAAK